MIPLEGKVLAGLDEFMLRLGHLKVLCRVASEVGGSWFRIRRETSRWLTALVQVPDTMRPAVAEYLRRKRLCPIVGSDKDEGPAKNHYRYPSLVLVRDKESGEVTLGDGSVPNNGLQLWRQDFCLASQGIPSRVGAITITGKSGSKTGLSHLADWAQISELISPAGDVAAIGRLLRLAKKSEASAVTDNPYILGSERLLLAYCLLGADLDLFSRLVPKLLSAAAPIHKAEAATMFADAMHDVVKEARLARHLSPGRQSRLYENYRDLEGPAKRSGRSLGGTSTAWHRASSRFESYVDLGLLEKGRNGEVERYEYVYYPTTNLELAARSLAQAPDGRTWVEDHLSAVIFGAEVSAMEIAVETLAPLLPTTASYLARPAAPLPIDALAVGAVCILAERSTPPSIGACRRGIERLAQESPELARLSRGAYGDRAEFVSLDFRALEQRYAGSNRETQ